MNDLQKLHQQVTAARDRLVSRYGVFEWRADARYPERNAVRIYKSRSAAERFADSLGYVVRTL